MVSIAIRMSPRPVAVHADTPIRRYADTPIRRYADTPIRRYADTPIRRYADTPIPRHADTSLCRHDAPPMPCAAHQCITRSASPAAACYDHEPTDPFILHSTAHPYGSFTT